MIKKRLFWFLTLFIFCVLGNSLNWLFLLPSISIVIFLMIKSKNEELFYLSLFLVPNIRIMDNIGVTFAVNILMSLPAIIYLFRKRIKIETKVGLFVIFLFCIELLHIIALFNYNNLLPAVSCFMGMLFCLSLLCDKDKVINVKKAWVYFVGGIFFSTFAYFACHIDYAINIVNNVMSNRRFSAFAGEPNYFALYICLALSVVFLFEKLSIWHFVVVFGLIFIGLTTSSKMCFILMAAIVTLGIVYNLVFSFNPKRAMMNFFLFVVLLAIAFVFRNELVLFVNKFMSRSGIIGNSIDIDALTSNRSTIINNYLNELKTNPIALWLGYGLQYYNHFDNIGNPAAHNTFFDILLAWGVGGTILFIVIICYAINAYKITSSNKRLRFFNFFPLLILLVNFMDLSCLNSTMFWWIVTFAIICIRGINGIERKNNKSLCCVSPYNPCLESLEVNRNNL